MKTMDFSETIVAGICNLKVRRCRQLIELRYMGIQGQGHFLPLAKRSFTYGN